MSTGERSGSRRRPPDEILYGRTETKLRNWGTYATHTRELTPIIESRWSKGQPDFSFLFCLSYFCLRIESFYIVNCHNHQSTIIYIWKKCTDDLIRIQTKGRYYSIFFDYCGYTDLLILKIWKWKGKKSLWILSFSLLPNKKRGCSLLYTKNRFWCLP